MSELEYPFDDDEAGSVRLRAILMTTTTPVLALLPMAVGLGEGSELARRRIQDTRGR